MPSRQIIPVAPLFWFSRHGRVGADAVGQLVWRLACGVTNRNPNLYVCLNRQDLSGLGRHDCGLVCHGIGRQPWLVSGVLRTAEAVTPEPVAWLESR